MYEFSSHVFTLGICSCSIVISRFFISVYSPQRANSKHIRKHLASLADDDDAQAEILINKKWNLCPFLAADRIITTSLQLHLQDGTFWFQNVRSSISNTDSCLVAYHSHNSMVYQSGYGFTVFCVIITFTIMHLILNRNINKRMERIEQQFPEALDILKRGLQAGYAFSDSIKLVYEELEGELSDEFKLMFNRINYGNDVHTALLSFVKRVPSTSAMAFCSSVSIHKETGVT